MANTEHVDDLQADKSHEKGCVTKCVGSDFKNHHGSYRKNGYDEHRGDAAKRVRYRPLSPERLQRYQGASAVDRAEQVLGAAAGVTKLPQLPGGAATAWSFTGNNFKNANHPFVHMYHHMVPWEVMSETFTLRELKLFQSTGYNINLGINLIILPCYERIAILIGMYTHPNDHPNYTLSLIEELTNVKYALKGDESAHLKKTEVGDVKSVLEAWERAEWQILAEAGKKAKGAHVDTYVPSTMAEAAANAGAV